MSMFDGAEVFAPVMAAGSMGARGGTDALGFHQGVVEAWNALDGTNTIRIHGNLFTNLLTLIGSEAGLILPGDVVGILRFQTTYMVLGRISAPGVEQRALGIVSAYAAQGVNTQSESFVDLSGGPSVTVEISSARRCLVHISSLMGAFDCIGFAGLRVSGASTIAPTEFRSLASAAGSGDWLNATRTIALTATDGLNAGSNTFTVQYKRSDGGGPGITEFYERSLIVQPF